MFITWLQTEQNANWDQLLRALRSPSVQLTTLANEIEQMLQIEQIFGDNYASKKHGKESKVAQKA